MSSDSHRMGIHREYTVDDRDLHQPGDLRPIQINLIIGIQICS